MNRYTIVKPHKAMESLPGRLVIDTNVAIDIEDFYYGRPRVRPFLHELRDTLLQFSGNTHAHLLAPDFNYSFAILEACSSRTLPVNVYRERYLRNALTNVLRWTREEVRRNFDNRHAPANRDKSLKAGLAIPAEDYAVRHPGHEVAARYGALLYLCNLDRTRPQGRKIDRVETLKRFVNWMTFELGVRGVYEMQLAIDLFLGNADRMNGARSLLKLGGRESPNTLADRAWNAAWDLEFLSLTEKWSYGLDGSLVPDGTLTFLLTRDTDPAFMRLQSELVRVNSFNGVRNPLIGLEWDTRADVDDSSISDVLSAGLTPEDLNQRMAADRGTVRRRALAAITKLEHEVGAAHAALDDGY